MKDRLQQLARGIDALNERVGRAVSWLNFVLVLVVCVAVAVRYLLNEDKPFIMELEWHLFSLVFLLGAGYTLRHDRHVRVDLFYSRFHVRDRALVNLVGTLFLFIPWCLMLIVTSWHYALESFLLMEGSPDPGGLPFRFVIKFAITAGAFLLLLQGLSLAITSWRQYRTAAETD